MDQENEIGNRLKKFRKHLDINQESFAEKIGTSKNNYSDKERGKSDLMPDQLVTLAKLGLNINWLLTGQGEMLLETQQAKNTEIQELKNKIAEIEANIRTLNSQNNSVVNGELETK